MIELVLLCAICLGEPPGSTALHLIHPAGVFQEEPEKTETEKPAPIPPLTAVQQEQVKRFVNALKNSNPETRRDYENKIIAMGRGALPAVLDRAETDHEHQVQGVMSCLAALLDVKDGEILDGFSRSPLARLRLLAASKYAAAARPADKEILKAFLSDSDRLVRVEAARGLVQLGDAAGVGEIILEVARRNAAAKAEKKEAAGDSTDLLAEARRLKGRVYSSHFRALATRHEDPEVRKAALEVIVAVGDRSVQDVLGSALDDDHNLVKAAAVNALRRLIKNEEPMEFPTVFALVDEVDKWKKELGLAR